MIGYLKATLRVFFNYRPLLKNLVNRDIKVKYRRSVLGVLWSVLNPLLMMLVMTLVFSTIFAGNAKMFPIVQATGRPPSFALYIISGQLIFSFYSESTSAAMDSVLGNAQLIKKVYIPKYIFPLEKVLFGFVNLVLSFVALIIVMIATRSPLNWWMLLIPVVLVLLTGFNLGIGLILSCMVVFFRDIKHLYSVFVLALTYMTPIFYPESIYGNFSAISYVVKFNPMYWYVGMFRQILIYGEAPTGRMWFATVACSAIALLVGLVVFRKKQDDFILHI